MCTVSMVYQYGQERIDPNLWNPNTWGTFGKLVKQAEEFDKVAEQADCFDPGKAKWAREVEERLRKLEAAQPVAVEQPMWEAS